MPKGLRRQWIAGLITVATTLLVGGCIDLGKIRSNLPEESRQARAKLKEDITRSEVREMLGSPYFRNEILRVEAYRKTGTDVEFGWAVLMPVVVPTNKHVIHFFVAYDEEWKVFDSEIGLRRLEAADLILVAASRGDRPEVLLATREMSRRALSTPPKAGKCALILLSSPKAMERVRVDGVQLVELGSATRYGTLSHTFSRHDIAGGDHTIEVAQKSVTGHFRKKFACKPEAFSFVRLEAGNIHTWSSWHGIKQEGEIIITTEPPPNANELRQILAHDDDWYGFAESYYAGVANRRANAANLEQRKSPTQ